MSNLPEVLIYCQQLYSHTDYSKLGDDKEAWGLKVGIKVLGNYYQDDMEIKHSQELIWVRTCEERLIIYLKN